jgi:hypothetical protein
MRNELTSWFLICLIPPSLRNLQVIDVSINELIDEVLVDANDRLELKSIKTSKKLWKKPCVWYP